MQRERHLIELTRYVVLNPVRAEIVASAVEWPWSSYRATVGLASAPAWLCVESAIAPFGTGDQGVQAYVGFVASEAGESSFWTRTLHQIHLGDQSFIHRARKQGMPRAVDAEVPTVQRGAPARSVTDSVLARARRDAAIVDAYAAKRETLKTLGGRYGLHYSQISRILRRAVCSSLRDVGTDTASTANES